MWWQLKVKGSADELLNYWNQSYSVQTVHNTIGQKMVNWSPGRQIHVNVTHHCVDTQNEKDLAPLKCEVLIELLSGYKTSSIFFMHELNLPLFLWHTINPIHLYKILVKKIKETHWYLRCRLMDIRAAWENWDKFGDHSGCQEEAWKTGAGGINWSWRRRRKVNIKKCKIWMLGWILIYPLLY